MDTPSHHPKSNLIKNLYLYLVSFVALMMVVFSSADIINIVLRTYVFTKADDVNYYTAPCPAPVNQDFKSVSGTPTVPDCEAQRAIDKEQNEKNATAQKQRDIVRDISMIFVGVPLFAFHWRLTRKKEV